MYYKLNHFYLIIELSLKLKSRQNHLDNLMANLLMHEEKFLFSSGIIHSALNLKKNRPLIDGKILLSQFPSEFIERYQNIHSVSQICKRIRFIIY